MCVLSAIVAGSRESVHSAIVWMAMEVAGLRRPVVPGVIATPSLLQCSSRDDSCV